MAKENIKNIKERVQLVLDTNYTTGITVDGIDFNEEDHIIRVFLSHNHNLLSTKTIVQIGQEFGDDSVCILPVQEDRLLLFIYDNAINHVTKD